MKTNLTIFDSNRKLDTEYWVLIDGEGIGFCLSRGEANYWAKILSHKKENCGKKIIIQKRKTNPTRTRKTF